ncbi:HAMP domain-containing histidine kinase [Petralouisia muris]|uniref:HAMP domain-containing histidine kinase n=1 Tax=Petralouisia muris TaxID=3032872 RepID=A0AC61RZP9_9FIRM|nr:HAMP domain-containing sensor histidine kinase [Petralouisia muris]TGY97406.1 HAMP domain-containing histidine kinase [Petralouisia muris]
MKKRRFVFAILLIFLLEAAVVFMEGREEASQDAVAVNKIVKIVENNWESLKGHSDSSGFVSDFDYVLNRNHNGDLEPFDYVVIDDKGKVLFKTRDRLSETISQAVSHRDTILDVEQSGAAVGKVMIYNSWEENLVTRKRRAILCLLLLLLIQAVCLAGYAACLYGTLVKPFRKLEGFAERIAGGNLDIPLEMDRQNLFGAFTESFDIMRTELKKARLAEAEANAEKKELVAKLSHDIKTPVASIKAASEVGFALAESERMRENYTQIIQKADQINSLVTNLFTATLEELQELTVMPGDMESSEIKMLLENADYLHQAEIPDIPPCLVWADRLRLQQVFDNIFANSYKYADTAIQVQAEKSGGWLTVELEDAGGGMPKEEIFFIKEKFRRGSNAGAVDGAGLGLFISDYFMEAMKGTLTLENGEQGLKVRVSVPLSGGM